MPADCVDGSNVPSESPDNTEGPIHIPSKSWDPSSESCRFKEESVVHNVKLDPEPAEGAGVFVIVTKTVSAHPMDEVTITL